MSNNLRAKRIAAGVAGAELARLTGISKSDICRIERGHRRPHPGWRRRIAAALRVSEAELFPEDAREPAVV